MPESMLAKAPRGLKLVFEARTQSPSQIRCDFLKVCSATAGKPHLIGINAVNDLRCLNAQGGKNETVTSSAVLVGTHFYPVRMAGLVRRASDGNGKASAGKY